MLLTDRIEDTLKYGPYCLHLDLTFDNVLLFIEMLKDEDFSPREKILIGLEMLIEDYHKVKKLDFLKKVDLFDDIIQKHFKNDDEQSDNKKTFDFEQDAELIYASFKMDYDIDLIEEQGKLHWQKFLALFSGLSEKTPFMQVVRIRTMDLPKPNKHNTKERQQIIKLKQKYALKDQQDINQAMDQAAAFLRRHAKVGE